MSTRTLTAALWILLATALTSCAGGDVPTGQPQATRSATEPPATPETTEAPWTEVPRPHELECLISYAPPGTPVDGRLALATPHGMFECLPEESLNMLMTLHLFRDDPRAKDALLQCLRDDGTTARTVELYREAGDPAFAETARMILTNSHFLALANCLSKKQWTDEGMDPDEQAVHRCMTAKGADANLIAAALLDHQSEAAKMMRRITTECGRQQVTARVLTTGPTPTPLPPNWEAETAALNLAWDYLGNFNVDVTRTKRDSWTAHTWEDAAMGCYQPDTVYAKGQVEGYVGIFTLGTVSVRVHVDTYGLSPLVAVNCIGGPTP